MTEKEKVFNKIATEEAQRQGDNISNFEYYSYYLCPDQYVGIIKNVTKKKRFWRKKLDEFDCRERPIFILLQESPHQDEYEYAEDVSERISIGPSNGETGIKIWKYLKKKLGKDYEQYKDSYLILMNHQTAFDQFFIGMSYDGPIYYLATEDIFSFRCSFGY